MAGEYLRYQGSQHFLITKPPVASTRVFFFQFFRLKYRTPSSAVTAAHLCLMPTEQCLLGDQLSGSDWQPVSWLRSTGAGLNRESSLWCENRQLTCSLPKAPAWCLICFEVWSMGNPRNNDAGGQWSLSAAGPRSGIADPSAPTHPWSGHTHQPRNQGRTMKAGLVYMSVVGWREGVLLETSCSYIPVALWAMDWEWHRRMQRPPWTINISVFEVGVWSGDG